MSTSKLSALSSISILLAASCGTRDPGVTYGELVSRLEKEAAGAVFPRVTSPGWHALGNGRPEMDVTGYSRVSYARDGAPRDVVEIFYHGGKNPRITTDDPSSVTIMGRQLQTYDSGNEDVAFATQPVRLTAPDGKTAYYSFQFNNERLYKSRDIPQFGW